MRSMVARLNLARVAPDLSDDAAHGRGAVPSTTAIADLGYACAAVKPRRARRATDDARPWARDRLPGQPYPAVSPTGSSFARFRRCAAAACEVDDILDPPPASEELLAEADRQEGRQHLLPCGLRGGSRSASPSSHLPGAADPPRAYLSTLAAALRARPVESAGRLRGLLYFARRSSSGASLAGRGARHIHGLIRRPGQRRRACWRPASEARTGASALPSTGQWSSRYLAQPAWPRRSVPPGLHRGDQRFRPKPAHDAGGRGALAGHPRRPLRDRPGRVRRGPGTATGDERAAADLRVGRLVQRKGSHIAPRGRRGMLERERRSGSPSSGTARARGPGAQAAEDRGLRTGALRRRGRPRRDPSTMRVAPTSSVSRRSPGRDPGGADGGDGHCGPGHRPPRSWASPSSSQNGTSGLLFTPGAPDALVEAIARWPLGATWPAWSLDGRELASSRDQARGRLATTLVLARCSTPALGPIRPCSPVIDAGGVGRLKVTVGRGILTAPPTTVRVPCHLNQVGYANGR